MKTKISRILGVGLALIMVLTMAGAFLPAKVEAALPAISGNVWSQFAFPQQGAAGGYFIDSTITALGPFAKAKNGDLYAFGTFGAGVTNRLFKSTNGGRSWTQLANYNTAWGTVLDFATSTEDANTLYILCSVANRIERTKDGGATFAQITAPAGAATLGSIAVGYASGRHYIFVGDTTAAAESAWYLDDSVYGAPWNGMLIGAASAVWEISTSPNFSTEANPAVFALIWVGGALQAWNKYGTGAWNSVPGMGAVALGAVVPNAKPYIAYVSNFDSSPTGPSLEYWVSVSSAGGANAGLYRIFYGGPATQYVATTDFTSVDVKGNAYAACAMGGTTAGVIQRSLDDGVTFLATGVAGSKGPSGAGATWVIMDDAYPTNGQALALVTGAADLAALSRQVADRCWNQISLIRTNTQTYLGAAFSNTAATDGTFFLSSASAAASQDSLWKFDGTYWERCQFAVAGGIGELQTSPTYSTDSTVFYANTGKTAIVRSPNGGAIFIPQTNAPAAFNGWRVIDNLKVAVGYAGTIAITLNSGASAWTPFTTGVIGTPAAIVLSPDFAYGVKGQMAFGNTAGLIEVSFNFGQGWVPQTGTALPATTLYPAFADNYDSTAAGGYLYCSAATGGVYRNTTGSPAPWTRIDNVTGTPTAGANVAADTMTITWNSAAAAEALRVTCPNGTINWTTTTNVTVTYDVGTATYTLTSTGAADPNCVAAVVSAPANGVFSVSGLLNAAAAITYTGTGSGSAAVAVLVGSAGNWSLPTAAGTTTANAFPVSASTGIVLANGTLYAVDVAAGEGMSRCLNPTANVLAAVPLRPYTERINNFTGGSFTTQTLGAGITSGLGIRATAGSTSLWAIDNATAGTPVLWRYDDTLVAGPALTSPASGGTVPDETRAALAFASLAASQQYDVQYDVSATFAVNPITVNPVINSSVLTALTAGTQYFWRVRVTAQLPCRSNWSPTFSFTTALGVGPWTPGATPEGAAPAPGAQNVNLRPAFQWNPSGTSTTGYEFALDDNADFSSPIVSVTVTNPVYDDLATDLAYGDTYYWKVRAVSTTGASNWYYASFTTIKAGTFTCAYDGLTFNTEAELEAHLAAAHAPTTPLYIWIVIAIGAVLVIAVIWLIFTTRRT